MLTTSDFSSWQERIHNTAVGFRALVSNTSGDFNTATGNRALFSNTTDNWNTANGYEALQINTTGNYNTAIGNHALNQNTTGFSNTAIGAGALLRSTTGTHNTANGYLPLTFNTTGYDNTAIGSNALVLNTSGHDNTAVRFGALLDNTTGNNNIAVGFQAGVNLATGSNNIYIGSPGGSADESNKIRIGTVGTQSRTFIAGISGVSVPAGVGVIVGTDGTLGTVVSSARFKEAIKPLDTTSEAILALKPVTFRYKHELDHDGIPQFGLVAEEVEKVNPALVARDEQGKPYGVRYDAVNAMLLNEFLKEHRTNEEQEATIAQQDRKIQEQEATITQLKKEMKTVVARLEEQAAQIQKVSAHLARASPSFGGLETTERAPQNG